MKKSIFERQKKEAEAKKAREQAENAAALEEFVKSFEDDTSRATTSTPSRSVPGGSGKRHFTSSGLKSGPGSLGPAFNRKRQYDDYSSRREPGGVSSYTEDKRRTFGEVQGSEEQIAARPTVQLSSLPPGTSTAVIKALFAQSSLVIENVRILQSTSGERATTERRSAAAIVTLAADTPGADIDTVVSQLQNRYVGYGFNLSISRHLSSTTLANVGVSTGNSNDLPFGAKPIASQSSLSRAPPPSHRFAPPPSYTSSAPYARSANQVTVQRPTDLKQLKLIHKTLEALLNHGPEFEALLMSRPEIQQDEKWAWLWNSRSAAGVYYRWRLWEILTDASRRRQHGRYAPQTLFDGQSVWQPPDDSLRFEYTTHLEEFVSDEDYNSSDEEDAEAGLASRYTDHNASAALPEDGSDETGYLNPLAKSKLIHLLARLPDTNTKLRKGDIARVTAFAIEHSGSGAEEVVMLVTRNVVKPFCPIEEDDHSSASQVGLYVVSDILSSSASAGVRHAWKYRTLFEAALRQQKVWERLGRAEKDFSWGKLKAEKWRRSIQTLLGLWEGWSVFPQASHEEFTKSFLNPPLTEKEKMTAEAEELRKAEQEAQRNKTVNRWRSVEDDPTATTTTDIEMVDVDGAAMQYDSDMDDVMDENIDGVPMDDSSEDEDRIAGPGPEEEKQKISAADTDRTISQESMTDIATAGDGGRRKRPRAADMFADESE